MNRKWIATTLAGVVLACCAGAAIAATSTYRGEVKGDEKTDVVLKVKRQDGERIVRSFAAENFLIKCEDDVAGRLGRASLEGEAKVDGRGRFHLSGSSDGQRLAIAGKVQGKRHAHGTLRYSGPTPFDEMTLECRSGELSWTAAR